MARRRSITLRHLKRIEPQLAVFVDINGQAIQAGTLYFDESLGQFRASFSYTPEYLERGARGETFALDPINLPLQPAAFETTSRFYRLGALFDAAPDAWGRTIMAKDEGISPLSLKESTVLLKGRGASVGAILFAPINSTSTSSTRLPAPDLPDTSEINQIYKTILDIEAGVTVDEALREMLMSSWDIGGARPKVVIRDSEGYEWITKFPRQIDTYSRQRVEWANLQMAKDIGMNVPDCQLFELQGGECALLVARFDRSIINNVSRRHHYLSAVSLISPPADFDKRQIDSAYGASIFSYARIADVIRQISSNVSHDLQELFARMVLNVLVHNTDDHLKNMGFLMDENRKGYRLSPLFDVVTQEGQFKHMIHVGPGLDSVASGRFGSIENCLAGAHLWGIKPDAAKAIVQRVTEVFKRRHAYYEQAGMSRTEIDHIDRLLVGDTASTPHKQIKKKIKDHP